MAPTAMPRKALVLGDDIRSLLSVIRSLGRGGIEIHIGWYPANTEALRSRYVGRAHSLPAYDPDDDRWKPALVELMERERFDLVIPCSDPTTVPLQAHRVELERHGHIYLLDDRAFRVVSNKFMANELARSLGIRVPRELVVRGIDEADQVREMFELPVVLKPQWSYDPGSLGPRRMVRKLDAWEKLIPSLREMLSAGPVAVQEYVRGRGVGVELLLADGRPLLEFQHQRLHEPPQGGSGPYRQSVPLDPELRDAALALLGALHYTGVAMVEFRHDPQTRNWAFIEVNGRFWGSLPLAVAAGADFPLALFQFLVEGRRDFSRRYRVGLCCRNWRNDLWWLAANLRARRAKASLHTMPLHQVGLEALGNIITLRERSDTFAWDDPGPALMELKLIARDLGEGLRWRLGRFYLQSRPTRRRLERRARAALNAASSILFVCLGNICRSPFAEGLARRCSSPARTIRSAGYYPKANRRCPDRAIECAARWGIDLHDHRSRLLSDAMLQEFEAVFVFDEQNHRRLATDFPAVRRRLHFVGALELEGPLFIADPFGLELADFERCYRQIAEAISGADRADETRARHNASIGAASTKR
jgi:protein-tyrosine-phosphatase/predicted ATP-grasp superfamily ATP-dependent carboligase